MFRGAALADIDGEGTLDVVFGSEDGILRALKGSNGQVIWTCDLEAHYGEVFEIDHAPVIADLDNDGRLDVFVIGGYGISDPWTNNHGRAYALTAGGGSGAGWPMFRHDSLHSACFTASSNQPPTMGDINGTLYGRPGVNYTFCITITDPELDNIFCLWDWGDGTNSGWLGPYLSGDEICATHAWTHDGQYIVKVKCKDESGQESAWSVPFLVKIDGTAPNLEIFKPQERSFYILNTRLSPFIATVVLGKILIEGLAVDSTSGISYVQFFIDDILQKNITKSPYQWLWTKRTFFKHNITLTAYDFVGNNASAYLTVWKFF